MLNKSSIDVFGLNGCHGIDATVEVLTGRQHGRQHNIPSPSAGVATSTNVPSYDIGSGKWLN